MSIQKIMSTRSSIQYENLSVYSTIVTVLADTPEKSFRENVSYNMHLRLTETLCQVYRSHIHDIKVLRLMFPISLTVGGKKETRNRYFLVDGLRDAFPADAKLFCEMKSKLSM